MYRSSSQQSCRLSYENISSRINRIRGGHSASSSILSKQNQTSSASVNNFHQPQNFVSMPIVPVTRPTSCYRTNLRAQQGGVFGLDLSNHVGRVSKNTGIKKYNQRNIREALNTSSTRMKDQNSIRQQQFDLFAQLDINKRVMDNPMPRNSPQQIIKPSTGFSTVKLYDYAPESNTFKKPCKNSEHCLQAGKIYSFQQLHELL